MDGPTVIITAEWPEVRITGTDDTPELEITAPPQPIIEITALGARGLAGVGAEVYEESFSNLDVWIVNHNFGRKPTSVQILSPGGVEVVADVVHIDDDQLRILFVQPYTGYVRVM